MQAFDGPDTGQSWWHPERWFPALLAQSCGGCGRARCGWCPLCGPQLLRAPLGCGPAGITALRSYDGVVRDLITSLKYRSRPAIAAWFAYAADDVRERFDDVDTLTWAPTSSRRRRGRGYDQSELVVRHLARRWNLPVRTLLVRLPGDHQTGRTRSERLAGPRFRARDGSRCGHILILDDVVTTGATLRAAVEALREGGAQRVSALALAATPRSSGGSSAGRPEADRLGR